jgi:hypothetical protein
VGTKIFAGTFSCIAAYATAAPWLPPDAATTPADAQAILEAEVAEGEELILDGADLQDASRSSQQYKHGHKGPLFRCDLDVRNAGDPGDIGHGTIHQPAEWQRR